MERIKAGDKVNDLLVLEIFTGKRGDLRARCECVCGNVCEPRECNVKSGITKSCGCLRTRKQTTLRHGGCIGGDSIEYTTWCSMRTRCNNPNQKNYMSYGGRGIVVCERWNLFENFFADMGPRPPHHSIERNDVNGNYDPSNCCWAPAQVQRRNTRTIKYSLELARELRRRVSAGETCYAVARELKIKYGSAKSMVQEKCWKEEIKPWPFATNHHHCKSLICTAA